MPYKVAEAPPSFILLSTTELI